MPKKIYITKEQLFEITGGAYFNNSPDIEMPKNTSSPSAIIGDDDTGKKMTGAKTLDSFAKGRVNNLYGFSSLFAGNGRKYTVSEVNNDIAKKEYTLSNNGIDNIVNAGPANDSIGQNAVISGKVSGQNLPEYVHRFKVAKEKAENGDSSMLNRMGGEETAEEIERLYKKAKTQSKGLRDANKNTPKNNGITKKQNFGKQTPNGIINYN